ncbi:MAG: hypothetical protein ACRCTY_04435 [Candidatus Adiutrix sp.]
MGANLGILCADDSAPLSLILNALELAPQIGDIKIVVAGRVRGEAISLARLSGLYAVLLPRSAYHANLEGYERRLTQLLNEASVDTVVLAGFNWACGQVLEKSFPRIIDLNEALTLKEVLNKFQLGT